MGVLTNSTVMAMAAVKDLNVAKDFYGGKLELKQTDENPAGVMYESGGGKLFVYQSSTAGSGQSTTATWMVNDVPAATQALKDKGVSFDKFDLPNATWDNDVAVMGEWKAAWFHDPDGNILGLTGS